MNENLKHGWVIYSRTTLKSKFGDNAFDWMKEAALPYGLGVEIIFEEDVECIVDGEHLTILHKGYETTYPDFVLMRSYALDLAVHLEQAGVKVYNSSLSMKMAQDKWWSHQLLAGARLPSPKSMKKTQQMNFHRAGEMFGRPFILKGLFGSKGETVYLVHNESEHDAVLKIIDEDKVLYQKFISESAGTDIRIHVIGNEVVAAVRRKSSNDFKSNYHQGGTAESVKITPLMKELSIKAARALQLDFAGIDVLESSEGPIICEVNAIPGFRTVCLTSDVDIPKRLFQHIARQVHQETMQE